MSFLSVSLFDNKLGGDDGTFKLINIIIIIVLTLFYSFSVDHGYL